MGRLKTLLSKKVAGIPVLYIVGLMVVGLAAYAYQTQAVKADDPATEDADPTPDDSAGGDVPGVNQPIFIANPGQPVSTSTDDTSPEADTNELWMKRSVEWLISTGAATPGNASNAISKYLTGVQLSYAEGSLRDKAITHFGLPPNPPELTQTAGKPAPAAVKQFSHFPGTHTIKGANDNSYTDLAKLYYGRTGDAIDLIQAANPSLGHISPLPVGTKVRIPAYKPPKYYKATSTTRTAHQLAAKNGISQAVLAELNDGMKFPVKVGTRVRVA